MHSSRSHHSSYTDKWLIMSAPKPCLGSNNHLLSGYSYPGLISLPYRTIFICSSWQRFTFSLNSHCTTVRTTLSSLEWYFSSKLFAFFSCLLGCRRKNNKHYSFTLRNEPISRKAPVGVMYLKEIWKTMDGFWKSIPWCSPNFPHPCVYSCNLGNG